jgi:hypothetical protein
VKNTFLDYALLLILATQKRSFVHLGEIADKSPSTIFRLLPPADESFALNARIARSSFKNDTTLYLAIDDTLIKKPHSKYMVGACHHFDTKTSRCVMSYKLLCSAITNGKYLFPLDTSYLFAKEVCICSKPKIDQVKAMVMQAKKIFPQKRIVIVADGAFASKEMLEWSIQHAIPTELRMHSNRTVFYNGEKLPIRDIGILKPMGLHMRRTITAIWHGMTIYITAIRRISKSGEETIVYQAATYKERSKKHADAYLKRWAIEKLFRTTKQYLGLGECFSQKIDVQLNHVAAVFLAYSIVQLEQKRRHFKNPEQAIRSLKLRKFKDLKEHAIFLLHALDEIFQDASGVLC